MMIKYSTENEMCKDVTQLISGILIPAKHKHIPEVPRFSGNDHTDMIFIMESGKIFLIEYKLSDKKGLIRQVEVNNYDMPVIGIINQKFDNEKEKQYRVFSYTGEDSELEKIGSFIKNKWGVFGKHHTTNDKLTIYWWGYRQIKSTLDGGLATCKRLSFFELYKQAIYNLEEEYKWDLDFYCIFRILGFYSMNVAKRYYKEVVKDKFPNGKV